VASFARLTLDLMACGAPPELLLDAQRAAQDEIRHAECCFALAGYYRGEPVGPGPFPCGTSLEVRSDLATLATTTLVEGCVCETLSAAIAQAQVIAVRRGDKACPPDLEHTLQTIANDEARHAELSWRIVSWALQNGGSEVYHAVHAAMVRIGGVRLDIEGATSDTLEAYGRLSSATLEQVQSQTLQQVILPCIHALLGHHQHRAA